MALNWGDVALNLTAGAIEKDEVYRKEQLEQRFKELQDNKELYRALATTRYSKDLDKYYKEAEKYENLQDVYTQIQSANAGKGMKKNEAARKIIFADPEMFAEWNSYGSGKGSFTAKEAMVQRIMSGFTDRTIEGKVVGYEFSHPGLELTSPKQKDYFQTPEYWSDLAKEIESKEMGPLKRQLVKLFRRKENHPAEVDLDTLEQKAGTDIKKYINNQLYTSSNMDKGTSILSGSGTGILKSQFDTDGRNEKIYSTQESNYKSWTNKANTTQEMFSILSQMGDEWIKNNLIQKAWATNEVRFKAGGEAYAQQVRALWKDVVDFHYENTFYEEGLFEGKGTTQTAIDTDLVNNFSFNKIINTFRNEYDRRNISIDVNDQNFGSVLLEKIGLGDNLDLNIPYFIDSDLVPFIEKTVVEKDGKKYLELTEPNILKEDIKDEYDVVIAQGLQSYIVDSIEKYVTKGETQLADVEGLESFVRAKIVEYYEDVYPKEIDKYKEETNKYFDTIITEEMIQSVMQDENATRQEVIEDFQKYPIKKNRKFSFPDDFDFEGTETKQAIQEQEEQINKANKLPFRYDGVLSWEEWNNKTAEEVYDAYITEKIL